MLTDKNLDCGEHFANLSFRNRINFNKSINNNQPFNIAIAYSTDHSSNWSNKFWLELLHVVTNYWNMVPSSLMNLLKIYFLQGCIKFLIYQVGWGRTSSYEKGKGNTMAVGKNITWEKLKGTGKQYHLPNNIFRLLGRISSVKKDNGTEILGKKIKI